MQDTFRLLSAYVCAAGRLAAAIPNISLQAGEIIPSSQKASVSDLLNSALGLAHNVTGREFQPGSLSGSYHEVANLLVHQICEAVSAISLNNSEKLNMEEMKKATEWYENFALNEVIRISKSTIYN
jgi:hypothetical protein